MNHYEKQAQDFLSQFGIGFEVLWVGREAPPWAEKGERHGDKYEIVLTRHEGQHKELRFPFWNSIAALEHREEPTAYDVLTCISGDLYCPESFQDFCGEYGYDEYSRKAYATWERCVNFSKQLREFFTSEDQEALSEIR